MTRPIERASGRQRVGAYPEAWGIPRGLVGSEERQAWLREMILEHGSVTPLQRLKALRGRVEALRRLAEIKRKRTP